MYGMNFDTPIIAFDFDQTISLDPEVFLRVMLTFELSGFQCIVVTYRHEHEWPEDFAFLQEKGYKVFFTGREAKRQFMRRKGYSVAIWVDDSPETIVASMDQMTGALTYVA